MICKCKTFLACGGSFSLVHLEIFANRFCFDNSNPAWIIQSFFLNNRKFANSIHLFIYFYIHRLIHNVYKNGFVNLKSGHKSIKCQVYIWNYLYLKCIYSFFPKYVFVWYFTCQWLWTSHIVCSPQQSCEMELQNNWVLTYEGCFGFHWVANAKESRLSGYPISHPKWNTDGVP